MLCDMDSLENYSIMKNAMVGKIKWWALMWILEIVRIIYIFLQRYYTEKQTRFAHIEYWSKQHQEKEIKGRNRYRETWKTKNAYASQFELHSNVKKIHFLICYRN